MRPAQFAGYCLMMRYLVLDQNQSGLSVAAFRYRRQAEQWVAEQDYPHDFEIVEEKEA